MSNVCLVCPICLAGLACLAALKSFLLVKTDKRETRDDARPMPQLTIFAKRWDIMKNVLALAWRNYSRILPRWPDVRYPPWWLRLLVVSPFLNTSAPIAEVITHCTRCLRQRHRSDACCFCKNDIEKKSTNVFTFQERKIFQTIKPWSMKRPTKMIKPQYMANELCGWFGPPKSRYLSLRT